MKTKNEIVDRLYKAGHIDLMEVLTLMEKVEKEIVYVPLDTQPWIQPYNPYIQPWTITCDSNPVIGRNSCLLLQEYKLELNDSINK